MKRRANMTSYTKYFVVLCLAVILARTGCFKQTYKGSYGSPGVSKAGYSVGFKKFGSGGAKHAQYTVGFSSKKQKYMEESKKKGFQYTKVKDTLNRKKGKLNKKLAEPITKTVVKSTKKSEEVPQRTRKSKAMRAKRSASPALKTKGKQLIHAHKRYGDHKGELKSGYGYY